jgi:hypothetical protein
VQSERWYWEQQAEILADGSYRLRVPYADECELLMDILRHGRHVEVEAPASLRQAIVDEVAAVSGLYPDDARRNPASWGVCRRKALKAFIVIPPKLIIAVTGIRMAKVP